MTDYMAAEITIGGCIARKLISKLCRVLRAEGLSLGDYSQDFLPQTAEDLLSARQMIDGELLLRFCNDGVAYGEFNYLEPFLQKYAIPYDRRSDGHYTSAPRLCIYRPKVGVKEWLATTAGEPLVEAYPLWEAREQLAMIVRSSQHRRSAIRRHLSHLATLLEEAVSERPTCLPSFEIGKTDALRLSA